MAYRYDGDLEFLKECSNEQLKELFSLLTVDPKDGEKRYTEQLTSSKEYKRFGTNYKMYWERIAEELQLYGGNTLANALRVSTGVLYREILEDVAKEFKIKVESYEATKDVEDKIVISVLESLNPEDKKEILNFLDEDLKKEFKEYQAGSLNKTLIGTQAFRLILKQGGFASYKLTLIAINAVWKKLFGKGLSLVANATVTKALFAFLGGPITWALNAWIIVDITSSAKRITVPAVLLIALLRKEVENNIR